MQIFDCTGMLCGRILWLQSPHDPEGKPKRDKKNPDSALRQRELCGMNVIWNLRPTGANRWDGGTFYNPDSGRTYDVKLDLTASDALEARFYEGASFLGETKTLSRNSTRHIERMVLSLIGRSGASPRTSATIL